MFTPSGCKDRGIVKFEFVTKNQFLRQETKKWKCVINNLYYEVLSWGKNLCFCHVFFSSEYRLVFDCTFSNTLLLRPRESPTSRYNQVYLISFIFANFVQRRFRQKSQLHRLNKFDFCLASKFYFFVIPRATSGTSANDGYVKTFKLFHTGGQKERKQICYGFLSLENFDKFS